MTDDRKPGERWNFSMLLVQGSARRVANELSSERLVLPFLYAAQGGAVFFAGLFSPVILIARLVAQLLGSGLVETTRRGNAFLALCTLVNGVTLVFLAIFSGSLPSLWLPVVFVVASAFLGMGSGFGALVAQNLMGRVLSKPSQVRVLFAIGAASGALVIVATVISQWLSGLEPRDSPAQNHMHLIWASAWLMAVSTITAFLVREPPRAPAIGEASKPGGRYLASIQRSAAEVLQLRWFRRFIVARVLFLSVEMVLPFFAVHAAAYHANSAPGLSLFVIAVSLGMIAGGLIWPRVSRKSLQRVMSWASLVGALAAVLAFGNHMLEGVQSPWLHAAMAFFLAFANQGTLDASTAYVVGSTNDEQRPYCIAVSNAAAAVCGVGLALLGGLIAEGAGTIFAILLLGALNVTAAIYASTLKDVEV